MLAMRCHCRKDNWKLHLTENRSGVIGNWRCGPTRQLGSTQLSIHFHSNAIPMPLMDANPTIVFQNRMRFKHTLEWNNATLTPPINRLSDEVEKILHRLESPHKSAERKWRRSCSVVKLAHLHFFWEMKAISASASRNVGRFQPRHSAPASLVVNGCH